MNFHDTRPTKLDRERKSVIKVCIYILRGKVGSSHTHRYSEPCEACNLKKKSSVFLTFYRSLSLSLSLSLVNCEAPSLQRHQHWWQICLYAATRSTARRFLSREAAFVRRGTCKSQHLLYRAKKQRAAARFGGAPASLIL